MGGKNGAYLRDFALQVQHPDPGHPFMELSHNFIMERNIIIIETFDDFGSCIPKQGGFHIVPSPGERIQLVGFPEPCKDFILL